MNDSVKNVWKPLCIVFAALLALSWVFFGFLYSKGGVDFSTLENPEQNYTVDGGAIIGEGESNGIALMSAEIPVEDFAANGISPMAETAYTLTATITPDNADNKAVDWTIAFVNPESEWATGKTVTDYVTVTPTSDGALTATVECLQAFGEQIKVVVISRDNTKVSAECTVDYYIRPMGATVTLVENSTSSSATVDFVSGSAKNILPFKTMSVKSFDFVYSVGTVSMELTPVAKVSPSSTFGQGLRQASGGLEVSLPSPVNVEQNSSTVFLFDRFLYTGNYCPSGFDEDDISPLYTGIALSSQSIYQSRLVNAVKSICGNTEYCVITVSAENEHGSYSYDIPLYTKAEYWSVLSVSVTDVDLVQSAISFKAVIL